jgi:hypothetical protein
MRYDLKLSHELCQELGLHSRIQSDARLEIELSKGVVLLFLNAEHEEDCCIAFDGTPWHTHDDIMFADNHGNYTELDYLQILTALKAGLVLICESWRQDQLADRWLIHRDYNDELRYLGKGEEIRIHALEVA